MNVPHRILRIGVGLLILIPTLWPRVVPVAASGITVTANGGSPGLGFDGEATIGAGGEARLVRDYTPTQLVPIFDYMFCSPLGVPVSGYCTSGRAGAAPAIYKAEIGGDTNSSVGAEPSFLRSRDEYNAFVQAKGTGQAAEQAACHLPTSDSSTASENAYWGRGYEWRLMRAAHLRNQDIRFYGLPWGTPGWIGGTDSPPNGGFFWTQDMIDYDLAFAYCAYVNGTPLSYLGVWNETPYHGCVDQNIQLVHDSNGNLILDPTQCAALGDTWIDQRQWINDLHNALANYTDSDPNIQASIRAIQLVGSDLDYEPLVGDMTSDTTFRTTIAAVGTHYECAAWPSLQSCSAYQPAIDLQTTYGKKLWASEDGPADYVPTRNGETWTTIWDGAQAYAELLNRYYIGEHFTSVQMVSALAGYYDALDFGRRTLPNGDSDMQPNPSNGMFYTNRPWSGYYDVLPEVWVMGHIGQFTQGPAADGTYRWRYIDAASCLGGGTCADGSNPPGPFTGSYTTFRQASDVGWTTVVETIGASASQGFTFCPTGGLAAPSSIDVWNSNLNTGATDTQYFVQTTVSKSGGCYSQMLAANHIYTLTTLTTGQRVVQSPPVDRPLRFTDIDGTFENRSPGVPYQLYETPKFFSDLEGAFQIGCGSLTGESLCLSQVATRPTIQWQRSFNGGANVNGSTPLTLVGEYGGPSNPPGNYSDSSTWWCNYSASVGVRINGNQWGGPPTNGAAGYAGLVVNYVPDPGSVTYPAWHGFELRLSNDNKLALFGNGNLVAGPVTVSNSTGWHIIEMSISGNTINVYLDSQFVFPYTDTSVSTNTCGFAGFTTGWNSADFDVLDLHPGP